MAKRRDTGSGTPAAPGSQGAPHGQRGLSPAARATALTLATRNARFLAHLRPSRPIGDAMPAFLQPLRRHAAAPALAISLPGYGHDAAAFAIDVQRRYGAAPGLLWPSEQGALRGDADLGLTLARLGPLGRRARAGLDGGVMPSEGDTSAASSPSPSPSPVTVRARIAEPLPASPASLAVPSMSTVPSMSMDMDEDAPAAPAPSLPRRFLSAVDPRLIQPVTMLETVARTAPRSAAGVTLPDMVVTRPMDDRRAQEANSGIARRQPARVMAALGRPLPLSVIRTQPRDNEDTDWSVAEGRETASNVAPFTSLPDMFDLAASLQRKPEPGAPSPNGAQRVGALRQAAQSTGQSLDAGTRRAMQAALGAELPDVRVHADTAAAEAASALGARAFTLGDAVYFAQGAFAPHTASGAALLGHELVHTLQQASPAPQQLSPSQAQDHGAARSVDPVAARDDAGATSDRGARLSAGDTLASAPARLPSVVDGVTSGQGSQDRGREAPTDPFARSSVIDAVTPGMAAPMGTAAADATSGGMSSAPSAGIMSGERIALFAQGLVAVEATHAPTAYRAADTGSAGVAPVPVTGSAGVAPVPVTSGLDVRRDTRRARPDHLGAVQGVVVGRELGALSNLTRGVGVAARMGADGRVTARAHLMDGSGAAGRNADFWPVAPGMGLLLDGAPVGASRSVYAALDMAQALNGAPARMGLYGAGTVGVDGVRAERSSPIGRSPDQPAYAATGRALPFVGMWGQARHTSSDTQAQHAAFNAMSVGEQRHTGGAGNGDSHVQSAGGAGNGNSPLQPRAIAPRSAVGALGAADALPGALDLAAAIGRKATVAMDMPVVRQWERQGAAPAQEPIIVARRRSVVDADTGLDGMRVSSLSGTLNSATRVAPLVLPGDSAPRSTREAQAPDASGGRSATSDDIGRVDVVGQPLDATPGTPASFGAAARMAWMSESNVSDVARLVIAGEAMRSAVDGEAMRRADVVASGMTDATMSARRGLEARGGDMRVADDVTAVSTMFPSLAGLAALQSHLPTALESVSTSRGQSYADQPDGSFYRGSWQPILVAAYPMLRLAARSMAAAGDAATGLTRDASATESVSAEATAAVGPTTTIAGPRATAPDVSTGAVMPGSGLGMSTGAGAAALSSQTPWQPLQYMGTSRRGVGLSRRMGASVGSFAESSELEDQAARAESAVLRLFSSAPMARPVASLSPLSPATMGSRMAASIGPSDSASAVTRRSDGTFVSSMPALSLSYATRVGAQTLPTASARPAEPVTSVAPIEMAGTAEAVRRAAGSGAAAPADGLSDSVARMIETTRTDAVASNTQPGRLGDQLVSAGGGQTGGARRLGLTPTAVPLSDAAGQSGTVAARRAELTSPFADVAVPVTSSVSTISMPADPFATVALDLGARAQAAWLGAMGIRGPVRASADLFRLGQTPASLSSDAAMLPSRGQGQGRSDGERSRSSGATPVSVAGALAGSTILPGMVSLAAGVQRQAQAGASTPALQRRLESLEQASSARGSGQSGRAMAQTGLPGQSGTAGYGGRGMGSVAWLPGAIDGVGGDGRVDRASADGSGTGSWDGSTPMIRPLTVGAGAGREAQASGREFDVARASGAWWTGSASPLLARFAQAQSGLGALNGVGLSAAVARLLDGGEVAPSSDGGRLGDRSSAQQPWAESGRDITGGVHRAISSGEGLGQWVTPSDPAALLMARAQDGQPRARAAGTDDATLLRRSGSAGGDGGMSAPGVPAAFAGAMAASTMLPGMLSLAASVQRKAEAGAGAPTLQRRLQALEHVAGSTGRPLESTVRRGMETVLGGDFSTVRVHADTAAASAASTLGARAFALGNAVYFSQGAYAPGTAAGAALLAHELTHTRQQAAGALDAPQRSALPGHEAGEGEPPELEAHAQRTEASVLRLVSDAPLARQVAATDGMGDLAAMLSRRAEGGGQEASGNFSASGPRAMLRRTAIATPGAGAVARTAAGAEVGGPSFSGSSGTLAGGMTVIGFPGATGGAAQRTAQTDAAGGHAAVSRQSGDGANGALPQAGNVAGHALPGVDELVGQVLDRVKRQIALDHERSGGFLSDLMR